MSQFNNAGVNQNLMAKPPILLRQDSREDDSNLRTESRTEYLIGYIENESFDASEFA